MAAAATAQSEGQAFLGATVHFYVPEGKVGVWAEALAKAGVVAKFDIQEQHWSAQAAMMRMDSERVRELIGAFGEGSPAHGEWRGQREARALKPAVAAARPAEGRLPAERLPAPRAVEESERDVARYTARAMAAREENREFLAKYVRYGFSLASAGARRAEQLRELAGAPPQDIREVAERNAERYGAFLQREDAVRFEFAARTDPEWKRRVEEARAGAEPDAAVRALKQEFARLDHREKRVLASVGRSDPVGLEARDRGLMISLSNGWSAMEDEYFKTTGQKFGQGLVTAASQRNSVIDVRMGSLACAAEETGRAGAGKAPPAAARVRNAVEMEV